MVNSELGESETWAWRSTAYAWWVVGVLVLAFALSLVDRLVLSLMVEPIKHDLALSDTQISLLMGLAFTGLYLAAGIPLGWIADRWNRRNLGVLSIFTWSVMTLLCGRASSFGQLFAARLGVGFGEAGLSPVAISMVSDYFPKSQRAVPLTILGIGATVGSGCALMFGGVLVHMIGTAENTVMPLIGAVRGWQAGLLTLGALGIAFTAVLLTIREPPRQGIVALSGAESPIRLWTFILRHRQFFGAHILGLGAVGLTIIAFNSWFPTAFVRHFGWTAAHAGVVYGGCFAIAGLLGTLAAIFLSSRLIARRRSDASLAVSQVATWLGMAPIILAPLMPHPLLAAAMLTLGLTMFIMPAALNAATLQSVCPNQLRGQVFAVYLAVTSIAYILGPLCVALVTNRLLRDETKVGVALTIVAAVASPVAGFAFARARRGYNRLGFSLL